ncbi:MAG: hypothetical protein EAX91_08505 [Candidatus Lokiarchaeota archaeon]|nr:hypothetical protein [Candidatus Lokiarchaeota archaeon]
MEKGSILSLISGIIVLVGTFFLTWFTVGLADASGIGLIKNLSDYFTNAAIVAALWGVPTFVIYIVGACYILFLASGVLILIGVKSRALAIIGSLMPIAMTMAILFGSLDMPADIINYVGVFLDTGGIIPGIIPYTLEIGPSGTLSMATVALGTYVMLVGGIIGFISGFFKRD